MTNSFSAGSGIGAVTSSKSESLISPSGRAASRNCLLLLIEPPDLPSLALLDGLARGVPHDARVIPAGVPLEHRRNNVLRRVLTGDDAREVSEVLLGFADRP